MTEVVLYGRPDCHLCEQALAAIERVRQSTRFSLRQVDIESDDALFKLYLERIPVVVVDGVEAFEFFVDESKLRNLVVRPDTRFPRQYSELVMGTQERVNHAAGAKLGLGVAARLSRYLMVLTQARKVGQSTISSQELADYTHVNSTQIRRDLSGFGKFGKRGVGYNVDALIAEIRGILRTSGQHNIALFGAGNLGTAIATSDIFGDHGFRVVALFDADPAKVGTTVGTLAVRSYDDMREVVRDENVVVAVLAVPSAVAQSVADDLVAVGVRVIFNYSEALLQTPPEVTVHASSPAVDLLYALYFYLV